MKCDCKSFDKRLRKPYMESCKYIFDGASIIDVGCYNGRSALELKDHLKKEHDIKTKITGIDMQTIDDMIDCFPNGLEHIGGVEKFTKDIENSRKRLDKFILSPVAKIKDLDETADFVLCFGFSCPPKARKESFLKMVEFLKPDGKAIFDVITGSRLECLWKLHTIPLIPTLLGRFPDRLNRKLMTKDEAIEHAKTCASDDFTNEGRNCSHGIIIYD